MLSINRRTHRLEAFVLLGLRQGGLLLVMMAVTRANLFSRLSPFAVAWFSACLPQGHSPWLLLAGCALGCPWEQAGVQALTPLAGCAIVLALYRVLGALPPFRGGEKGGGLGRDGAVCALAAPGGFIPPLFMLLPTQGLTHALISACLNALLAMCLAPVLSSAARLDIRRRHLAAEEILSLALAALLCLMGVHASPLSPLALPLAALITLILSREGPAQGAAAGAACGLVFVLGGDPLAGAGLGVMGLVAGSTISLGRIWSALAFLLVSLACASLDEGAFSSLPRLLFALPACLAYPILPREGVEQVARWFAPGAHTPPAEQVALALRQGCEKQLLALGDVFSRLARGCKGSSPGPDEQALVGQMRQVLCAGCPGYAHCWNGTDHRAGRMLCKLLGDALSGGALPPEQDIPVQWGRSCRRAAQISRKLGPLLQSFRARRQAHLVRQEGSRALEAHFDQAARILENAGDALSRPLRVDAPMSRCALAALEQAGLQPREALVLEGQTLEVCATRKSGFWQAGDIALAARALSRALGLNLEAVVNQASPQATLRLVQSPALTVTLGHAARSREGKSPSGDSFLTTGLPGGQVLMALSDGMGSGPRAARESRETLDLVRRFLIARVEDQLMLESINQLLLLHSDEEMYATCDLCVMDLEKGLARFSKLGGCASFLLRRGKVQRIQGGRLPLGILDRVVADVHEVPLKPGDTLVMITDGVADGAIEEENQWLEALLLDLGPLPPALLCQKILEAVCALSRRPKDDMTVLAARIRRAR